MAKQGRGRRGRKVGNNANAPTRKEYWRTERLLRRKARRLMTHDPARFPTFEAARAFWERVRKGRVKR